MKVLHFQTYQAVRFAKGIDTFFSPQKFPGIKIEAQQLGIRLEWTNNDSVRFVAIVPYANIAYFEPIETVVEPKISVAKK